MMAKSDVRALTDFEVALVRPEVEVFLRGVQAQERLQRMIALLGSELGIDGLELDVERMVLIRPVIEQPAPEPEVVAAPGE